LIINNIPPFVKKNKYLLGIEFLGISLYFQRMEFIKKYIEFYLHMMGIESMLWEFLSSALKGVFEITKI
jgi:hypothetical protein